MAHPPLTLDEYRAFTYHLSRPSRAQLEAFALHVSQAHSWYKHIPFAPPGNGFCFYIDPFAGMDIVQRPGAGFELVWRNTHGFHYNQLATAEHRERFGHMAFCSGGREMVPAGLREIDGLRIPADAAPMIYDPRLNDFRRLPAEIMRAGAARFSSVVHQYTVANGMLHMFLGDPDAEWPEESGGAAMLGRLRERLADMHREDVEDSALPPAQRRRRNILSEDALIGELLAPERRRQHLGMVAAAQRVIGLIAGATAAA